MKVRVLSIRQPWAWLIVRPDITNPDARFWARREGLIKGIENRSWATNKRGGFLVHASRGMTREEYESAVSFARGIWTRWWAANETPLPEYAAGVARVPELAALERGGIVGYAELRDCVSGRGVSSPWYMGEQGFVLADQQPLPFLPLTGALGFFHAEVPDDYLPAYLRTGLMP